ncbi:MAG TPA: adenylate/guanylate cyclase domain-containing protein [Alphaproteobacteria bacterium]|nr:adenylate/guanylate cyclase domain-containing protein [Alphaproteobacteria bacterium]
MAAHNRDIPEDTRIVFRIGVNLGDVALMEGDVYGDGVNIAARLQQIGAPGDVIVSGTAYDHLQGKLAHPLDYLREKHVKNIARPVRAYRVRFSGERGRRLPPRLSRGKVAAIAAMMLAAVGLVGVAAWWYAPGDAGLAAKASIAVLPLENLSGDEATARLADGLTEDIITDLSRWREFDVIARNSTAVYKGKPVDVRQVGRELNVRYVLEGSVQRHENKLRLTAQLVSAETGAHLWSEHWDRPAEDVFAVQSEIAQQVAVKISLGDPLWQSEYAAARHKLPQDLTAYELYLLGSEKMDSPTKESVEEAIRLLTEAVERDPGLVRGWGSARRGVRDRRQFRRRSGGVLRGRRLRGKTCGAARSHGRPCA